MKAKEVLERLQSEYDDCCCCGEKVMNGMDCVKSGGPFDGFINSSHNTTSSEEEIPVVPPFTGYVRMGLNRMGYGRNSTIGVFVVHAYDADGHLLEELTGYTLERQTDDLRCRIAGSDTAIEAGTYKVIPSTLKGKSGYFELINVPGRSGIKIHHGNDYRDTHGCLLVGSVYSYDSVTDEYRIPGGSIAMLEKLREFLNKYNSDDTTIYISY